MKKQHPAHWECEWISANAHRYQNPLPDEQIKRRIITRSSFQRGQLLRDPTLFESSPGWIGEQFGQVLSFDATAKVAKRINFTDKDPDLDTTGFIQLLFPNETETFVQVVERYGILAQKYQSLKELFEDYHIHKEYSINQAVWQIAEEEIGEGAVYFMSQGSWGMIVTAVFQIEQVTAIYQFIVE